MKPKILSFLVTALLVFNTYSQNEDFHIYLCFGQSNMEGQGIIEEIDKVVDDRFKVLQSTNCEQLGRKKGEWYPATPPLSQCWTGLSPSDYFGRTMVKELPENVKIGVINVSVGGCDIRLFNKNLYQQYDDTYTEKWFTDKIIAYEGNPYKTLIDLAKKAQEEGVIKGILLHQGETNTNDVNWPSYVKTVYKQMLADLELDAEAVPLLAGELAHSDQNGKLSSMNSIIAKLPESIPTAHVISSSGCAVMEDKVHFNSRGIRELGKRYALKMLELLNSNSN